MPNRLYKILEKGFYLFFYILLVGLFLKGEVFRVHTSWFSLSFTSIKNFVLVFILWWLTLRIMKRPRVSFWLLPVLILGAVSISFSIYPLISIRAGWVLLIYIFWFYCIWDILGEEKNVINTTLLLVILAGLVNIADLYFHYSIGLGEILEKYPFWEGKNALGLFLVMALCMSGSLVTKRGWSWLSVINSMLIVIGIAFSYSRSAWISGVCALIGLIIYKFKKLVWVIIGCTVVIFIISPSLVSERFNSIFRRDDLNIKYRLEVWEHTIGMVKNKPIIGTGLGTFTEAFRSNYPELFPLTGSESRPIRHAHNLYLQILAETGILGLVIFLFLVITGFIYGIRNFIKENNQTIKSIRYGSLLGIVVFLVYSITDCTISWQFIGDSFSHINLIFLILWVIVLKPRINTN